MNDIHNIKEYQLSEVGSFGYAINALKVGRRVARKGWNGKDMFIFLRPQDKMPIGTIPKIKSLPETVKNYFRDIDSKEMPSEQGLAEIKFTSYLCMKAADGSIVNGWLASQTDMLENDWEVLNP